MRLYSMRRVEKVILVVMMLLSSVIAHAKFENETLQYVVRYKWGPVQKEAGDATVTLRNQGSKYKIMLTAKTRPWADKIYQMRDTLVSTVAVADFKPVSYTKIAHEDKSYARDDISFSYHDKVVLGTAKRHKIRKNGKESRSTKTLSSSGRTFDFLSAFYYVRMLDYAKMKPGVAYKVNVFSGKMTETLSIRCLKKEEIRLYNGKKVSAWKLSFTFTSEGGKTSSDNIYAWVSPDAGHAIYKVVGSLPIGQIQVFLK